MGLSTFSIGLSGMHAAMSRLNVAADNIARVNVVGAERNEVVQSSDRNGGVKVDVRAVEMSGDEKAETAEYNPNNIDLAYEFIQQDLALFDFQANVYTVNTEMDMMGSLLNIKI